MTNPQIDTFQYQNFLSQLNRALPLELTIRAADLECPQKLEELRCIDAAIRTAWEERGFTAEEVADNGLAELCWDLAQLGWNERRMPFEVWQPDVHKMIEDGLRPICEMCLSQVKIEDYPFARRYRYADLVRGMNVDRVLREYIKKYSNLRVVPDSNYIPSDNFIYSVRAPVPVVPGAIQNVQFQGPQQWNYLGLMLKYDMSLDDVRAALLDFQYHYAEFRVRQHNLRDETTQRLLDPWGSPSQPTKDDLINQANEVHPYLAGLYAYDRFVARNYEKARGARARAIDDTVALYPTSAMPDKNLAGKWLDSTRVKIKALAEKIKSI